MRTTSLIAALAAFLATGSAQAADVPSPMVIQAPPMADTACSGFGVLARIKHRFAAAEHGQWHRGFTIESISNPRLGIHPYAEPGIIKRTYCVADSVMTNGSAYPVYYAVEHRAGFVGIGNYVDFCVAGLDPWHVHDSDCRTVR